MRSKTGFLAVVVLLLFALSGIAQAQWTYSFQDIFLSSTGYLNAHQGFGGWTISERNGSGDVVLNLGNTKISGLFSVNVGLGSAKNQGSVIQLDIIPNVNGVTAQPKYFYFGLSSMESNRVIMGNTDYTSSIKGHELGGSGILAVNMMAGSLNNQFTSVRLVIGPRQSYQAQLARANIDTTQEPTFVVLTNDQLYTYATAKDNQIIYEGTQHASASIEPNAMKSYTGIGAVNQVCGALNQVTNNVRVNVNLAQ